MFNKKLFATVICLHYNFALILCTSPPGPVLPGPSKAVAVLSGNSTVTGQIVFSYSGPGQPITITGTIKGLKPGHHGFHIHQFGNLTAGCVSAGPHYNPFHYNHSSHDDSQRHAGDFGNINADQDGEAQINITDSVISLSGPTSVLGRAVVVHEKVDDLGKGGDAESLKTGNAGGRLACGVIGLSEESAPPPPPPPHHPIN